MSITEEWADVLKARHEDGVAFLDKARPGWADEIHSPDALDIMSGSLCVSAQLSGSTEGNAYVTGMNMLGLDGDTYDAYGFRIDSLRDGAMFFPSSTLPLRRGYVYLTELWKAAITERRTPATA